ncbi:aconitate hydratase AcnA [Sedimenticola sp.]|uniref:aconitate hydratase AcnA n=1 Tax=Sedimenticola sp. TaxID=1940285 RepID=UPI003D145D87
MSTSYTQAATLTVGQTDYTIYPFDSLQEKYAIERLPYSLRILLENLLRHGEEIYVTDDDIEFLANWNPKAEPTQEIAFVPSRVLLQDFTGVPAIVDLAAMRDAIVELGGSASRINPLSPVELVIDHSVMVDHYGTAQALNQNTAVEIERNLERYKFLRWGQTAFENFRVVPPGTGIVHQVNLEYLARGVFTREEAGQHLAYPDTLVGTDSHTTMINGLGVLGWGVGGIEAEAAMLGQPITMLVPQVVGFRLLGRLAEGATATDLVLTITERLRQHGVVGKFVEFFGPGMESLSLADRATIANMAPEYGATCGIFPVDRETLRYLRLTGRDEHTLQLVEAYMRRLGLWHDAKTPQAEYSALLTLDLTTVVPSIAGPKRPQDRIPLTESKEAFTRLLSTYRQQQVESASASDFDEEGGHPPDEPGAIEVSYKGEAFSLEHGAVVIAAITSCTNTSNPAVLVAAGLLARRARQLGLKSKPWVKTSLAPGSKVVTDYLQRTGLLEDLEALGFYLVGYGCTTCIGNSGPLADEISRAIARGHLLVTSVLSGNRNFEGRIHQDVRANYLASPPLVVAYALAGNMGIDLYHDPIGLDKEGKPVTLSDLWPDNGEVQRLIELTLDAEMFKSKYRDVYSGNETWNQLPIEASERYAWPDSTYVRQPTFFQDIASQEIGVKAIEEARCLVKVGDSTTTDHISPAGTIAIESPAGQYLKAHQIAPQDFNSYGSRRGNHEVMVRGTFANIRLKNQLAPGTEGSWTTHFPSHSVVSIFDAAEHYRESATPLIVLAGKEYGTGSSRDWAAKGPALLGVRAVIAESYERIHRSNLIGMGILPLQFLPGESAQSLGLDGSEFYTVPAITLGLETVDVSVKNAKGETTSFRATIRIDTPNEFAYYKNGGILHFVLRRLAKRPE